ncbi:MAG: NUDIX domain-containing protein [Bacteroidaceae bacterium]|nr:NUDIX domain-containing protein [Bacteroidaceae bacterium]
MTQKAKEYYRDNPQFYVAVDCIIFAFENDELQVLLQQRNFEPFRGEKTLLGGFLQDEESLEEAAQRVLHFHTGLTNIYMEQVGTFSALDRDPGARVISTAYYALINKNLYDSALLKEYDGEWVSTDHLPNIHFDHTKMIEQARELLRRKISFSPVGFNLLPPSFTLAQLQRLYEVILGQEIDKRNFRKRVSEMQFIEKTGEIDKVSSRRGASLFQFNMEKYNLIHEFKLK